MNTRKASAGPKKNIAYNRLGMLAITVTAVILLVIMMQKSRALSVTLANYQNRAEVLAERIEEETERTDQIKKLRLYMRTDDYVEQVARERLGLVKENEIVFEEVQ